MQVDHDSAAVPTEFSWRRALGACALGGGLFLFVHFAFPPLAWAFDTLGSLIWDHVIDPFNQLSGRWWKYWLQK